MTAQTFPPDGHHSLVEEYRTTPATPTFPGAPRSVDELFTETAGAEVLRESIDSTGLDVLRTRVNQVETLVRDEGITYGGQVNGHPAQPWRLDPLPLMLDAEQWNGLEAAVQQRSRLMDALYADLYGRRRVLADRLVPAEVVLGHRGFLPIADQVRLPGKRQLVLTAQDLARGTDGAWLVVGDRVQAPSGAGYAMANRRVIARAMSSLHRRLDLRRLRGFFDLVQAGLLEAAHPMGDVPHVALLSPGPASESAYDQAILSTLLGYPLVQSDDLVMRGGRLWMRTTGRLAAVDVLLRRVDAEWCDSLDLRADSRLGVPGLAAASARGNLGVVNPLGSGVLENPALIPFLGRVSQSLLGEALLLEQPQTWWCGDDTSRQHVLAHLDRLVIKPISRDLTARSILGWQLDTAARNDLQRQIEAEPWAWTGQEPVAGSTTPVVTRRGLEARPMVLRTFATALEGDYHVMPGGLARVAGNPGDLVVTNSRGALSKDVWVLDSEEGAASSALEALMLSRARFANAEAPLPGLSPRAAENLFWMGRYAERAEFTARLLLVADNLVEDHHRRPRTQGHAAMQVVLRATARVTTVHNEPQDQAGWRTEPLQMLRDVALGDQAGSLLHAADAMIGAHGEVRELLSLDTSTIIGGLLETVAQGRDEGRSLRLQQFSAEVLASCLALAGMAQESLVRDATWAFLDTGRRVERAQATVRLLLDTVATASSGGAQNLVVESVLRVADSSLTHRRRLAAGVGLPDAVASAVQLVLADQTNPRSVISQLDRISEASVHAPSVPVQTEVRELVSLLRGLDLSSLCSGSREGLQQVLLELDARLRALSELLERTHFVHQQPQINFEVPDDVIQEEMR